MRTTRLVSFTLALLASGVTLAQSFDGSVPLECTAQSGHDCLPQAKGCTPLQPESSKPPVLGIDFARKQVRSPFRTTVLNVQHTTQNAESLVLQGADLLFAWSTVINKTTGALTLTIADRKGAYIVFGQCKTAAKAAG
ncbi:MAG TPA: hypothetical protein VJS42_12095 [Steroidobacteraceae bacterium]|nr:hypothetical protein [Steroidobacteraceae bacterium]